MLNSRMKRTLKFFCVSVLSVCGMGHYPPCCLGFGLVRGAALLFVIKVVLDI